MYLIASNVNIGILDATSDGGSEAASEDASEAASEDASEAAAHSPKVVANDVSGEQNETKTSFVHCDSLDESLSTCYLSRSLQS